MDDSSEGASEPPVTAVIEKTFFRDLIENSVTYRAKVSLLELHPKISLIHAIIFNYIFVTYQTRYAYIVIVLPYVIFSENCDGEVYDHQG